MAMVVQHNLAAQLVLGELNKNNNKLQKSLEKVSSGQKVNSAKDNASVYSISEKMREQIRTLQQDNQNVQNGTALFRIADGGINSIVDELRNLKEMAINAANDTNNDIDRAIIQKEFRQRMANINDIATETNYNGKVLLDGTYSKKFDTYQLKVINREMIWIQGNPSTTSSEEIPAPPYNSVYQDVSEPSGSTGNISGSGSINITQNGTYTLLAGYTGTINVNAQNVKIVQADPSTALSNVQIIGPSGGNANLWIENLNITNTVAQNIRQIRKL